MWNTSRTMKSYYTYIYHLKTCNHYLKLYNNINYIITRNIHSLNKEILKNNNTMYVSCKIQLLQDSEVKRPQTTVFGVNHHQTSCEILNLKKIFKNKTKKKTQGSCHNQTEETKFRLTEYNTWLDYKPTNTHWHVLNCNMKPQHKSVMSNNNAHWYRQVAP